MPGGGLFGHIDVRIDVIDREAAEGGIRPEEDA
jgi:hypothetical protein